MAGLAAVLDDPDRWRGRRVGVILTGGNIDGARFDDLTVDDLNCPTRTAGDDSQSSQSTVCSESGS